MSEFSTITDYSIIKKILYLIEGDKLLSNSNELN